MLRSGSVDERTGAEQATAAIIQELCLYARARERYCL